MPGEFDFIHWIQSQQKPSPLVNLGIGDDLAVLNWPAGNLLLIGTDQVLDGVHFDSAIHTPRQIGQKAMNRNLSDCAAMACLPAAAVATVALPKGSGMEYARELFLGIKQAADVFNCSIVGGDTGSWAGKLVLTVTILGQSAGVKPISRGGAKPGDTIYVTGPLGGSILGRHMTFHPRVTLARALGQAGGVTAMIDLSDGLSRDLGHICQTSGVGAVIKAECIPIHEDAITLSSNDQISPLQHALNDGEDYELLFTGNSIAAHGIEIGRIVSDPGIWIEQHGRQVPLPEVGWEHAL